MLKVQSLSVRYGSQPVIYDLTLELQAGEILALVGPNGAGKSTLIRTISGIHTQSQGSIQVDGKDLGRLPVMQRARYMAVVPQARGLPGSFTVYQTVMIGRTPYLGWLGHPSQTDHRAVQSALDQTHTRELADRRVGELSGGEQQRVLLARALAQDTSILLLDEPTTHLDLQHQSNLLNLVQTLCKEKNLAVMMVLHDLNLAGLYADRVALLSAGRLEAVGAPGKVLTSAVLSQIYRVPVHVIPHPDYGSPLVLPDGREIT